MTHDSRPAAAAPSGGVRLVAIWSIMRLVWRVSAGLDRGVGADRATPGPIARLATVILDWRKLREERRSLEGLNDHMLKDIGLSRCDVEREIRTRRFGR